MEGLKPLLAEFKPDVVLVHGDTTTTLATAWRRFIVIPVGHVQAGFARAISARRHGRG
ncbi:UDP-N-acetylglucosamine 2-epimerase [Shigella flexneri]